jgi:hypothetical protein
MCVYIFQNEELIGIRADAAVFPDISLVAARDSHASEAGHRTASFTEELV